MELRSSANYSWNIKDVLGQGATGAVYKGRHKKTGEVYAVKVFNNLGMMRPPDVRRREFEVLRKLHHENIVKLFDSETELRSQNEVILMELCSGGSLFTMLESPENAYGFSENDFKQVVRDVVAGMQHLREQGIVHRDLKPGNIMRLSKEDGSFVYKLTDFGAARELEPSEEFLSVYGTEEYLHPDLYERGVLRKHGSKAFNAVVDLWSIGVTFYHIATGQLPFRPYGGRQNKDTMYTMTSKKAPGIISGFQKSEGEEIEWSDKLPEHTRLSQGLRDLLTPVLAGILESDPVKAMSFEEFFFKAQDILTRKVIDVYSVHSSSFHKIYIKPQETFAKFQELIAVQTGVSAAQQKLFFKFEEFRPDLMAPSSTYPNTSDDLAMLMTGGEYITPERLALQKIPKAPKLPEKSTLEVDASIAKIMASRAYFCKHAVQLYHRQTRAMLETIESLLKNLKRESLFYASFCKEVELQWHTLKQVSSNCYASQSHLMSVYESLLANLTEPQRELEAIQEDIHTVKSWIDAKRQSESELNKTGDGITSFRKLLSDIVENNRFYIFMVTFQQDTENQNFHKVVATYTTNFEEIYQSFRRDKHHRRLPYADEHRHQFDRKNLVQLCDKLTKVTEEAVGKRSELHGQLENWLNEVNGFYHEAERLHSSLARLSQARGAHLLAIHRFQEQCTGKSQAIVQQLQRLIASPGSVTEATADKSITVTVNGLAENERDSGVLQRIENELNLLSLVTKESSRTARLNSEQLKMLVENFIMLYSSINEHMMKDLENLQQTVTDESPPSN